jgi:uncharacterized protein (TIGR02453 family)
MSWFSRDTFEFFHDLEQNNDRDWFAQNKKRYEASVKNPMLELAAEMIERIGKIQPISMLPKDAVFRIHRDTRFSKDKSPYKTNAGMLISKGGKGDHATPGLYFHIDAQGMGVASGCYMLETDQLRAVREHIIGNLDEFQRLLDGAPFKERFGSIQGEKNKVLPAELRDAASKQPLLFNKQFYYWAQYGQEEALRDDLPEFLMQHLEAAQPMNAFFESALAQS